MDAPDFDPRTATEYEIIARAQTLPGRRVGDLSDLTWKGEHSSAANKGAVGAIIERYFGIAPNTEQAPDFAGAGIELKVAPLVMDGQQARRIKERTSVTMIDFMALDGETWQTASVRPKIQRVLFVFYEWRPGVPVSDFVVRSIKLWSPPGWLMPYLERDWVAVWTKNHEGRAHEISEGDGAVLGAATKGATGGKRPQPHSPEMVASRAWSLKPKLTWTIYQSTQGESLDDALLSDLRAAQPADAIEQLLGRLTSLVGRTAREIGESHGVEASAKSKQAAVDVVRRAIGIPGRRLPLALDSLGVELKFFPVAPDASPRESMSFPAFDHRELADEEWEDSDLLARVQNMVLVPFLRESKDQALLDQRLCRPIHWSPDREVLRVMRVEWERYRDRVAAGRADDLPHESETQCIHVRTKGRDSRDRVEAPGGLVVTRKAFWLNREFLREIVLSSHSDWRGF